MIGPKEEGGLDLPDYDLIHYEILRHNSCLSGGVFHSHISLCAADDNHVPCSDASRSG